MFFSGFFFKHNLPEVKACKSVDLQALGEGWCFSWGARDKVFIYWPQLHGNEMFAEKTHTRVFMFERNAAVLKTHSRSRAKEPDSTRRSNCVPDIWSMHFVGLSDRAEQSAMGPDSIGFISTFRFCWTRSRPPAGMCKAWKYHVEERAISSPVVWELCVSCTMGATTLKTIFFKNCSNFIFVT